MNKKITITSIIFLIVLMLMSLNVFAATGSFEASAKSKSLTVGDTTTLSITAKECAGVFTVTSSNPDVVSVGSVPDWIEEETKTVTLTSKKAGTATITVTASDVGDTDANAVTGSKTIEISVKDKETPNTNTNTNTNTNSGTTTEQPKEKSSNAYLSTLGVRIKADLAKELGVETNEYDFSGFSKKKKEYTVTIPSNVDYLKVEYKTADSNAKVKVTGNSEFEVGSNNKITIKVTAEDGKTTQTYTIKVTQLAEEEEKPGNVIEDEEGLYLTSLELNGIELSPEFAKDTYSYTATLSEADITEIKVNAIANKENAKIEITGNTNLIVGENTINIVVKEDESLVQTVYQIVLTKEEVSLVTTTDTEDSNLINNLMVNIKNYIMIAVIIVVLIVLIVIILIILLSKENKRLKNENTIEETDNEYDVYKNDENEFEVKNEEINEIQAKEEDILKEAETKNKGRRSRREKGKHSK